MQDKIKNIIVTIEFVFILLFFFGANLISKDNLISISERRKLMQFPSLNIESLTSGKFMTDFNKYSVDQFVMRDDFRKIKYLFSTNIYHNKDNNGLFVKDSAIYKMIYPINKASIQNTSNLINEIKDKYLTNNKNIYYSIIPDKSYYLEDDHLKIDFDNLVDMMQEKLPDLHYIDISKDLDLASFYQTDLHWKQPEIFKVVNEIENALNLQVTSRDSYTEVSLGDFYGAYSGQIGISILPDKINYLNNSIIQNSSAYNYELDEVKGIYDFEKYSASNDKYDFFLSGATPLIDIYNPNSTSERELLLFRDSFGSSIAPLLIQNYQKITLIDLRYISKNILSDYINFDNQDVLFLYSTEVINSNILK